MPYVPVEQRLLMGQQQQSGAAPGNTSTNAGQEIKLRDDGIHPVMSIGQQRDRDIVQAV
jgi:hypothetical protein